MKNSTKTATSPFSLRLTFDERAKLDTMAKGKPLGLFIRTKLFEGSTFKSRDLKAENNRANAQILGLLGQSEFTKNVTELASAARSGSLDINPDTEKLMITALEQLILMKELLLKEMKIRSGDRP